MRFKNLHTFKTKALRFKVVTLKLCSLLLLLLFTISLNAQTCDNLTDGGAISGEESGCNSPTFDPSPILSTDLPSGGTGEIEYIWMMTTGDPNSPFNTWQIIQGANGVDYDPGPISQTTYFGRCSRRAGCTEYVGETNFVAKTISCCNINVAINSASFTICPGQAVALSVISDGSNLSYSWSATGGNFNDNTSATPIYTIMMEGTYTVSVSVTMDDCTETAETTITVSSQLPVSITADHTYLEANGSLQLNSTVSGDSITYAWSASGGTFNDATIANPTYTHDTIGDFEIYLTATDENGCSGRDTFDIAIGICDFELSGGAQNATCVGDDGAITLIPSGATGTISYTWTPNSIGNISNPSNLSVGMYSVIATDSDGCTDTLTLTVGTDSGITISPDVKVIDCFGDDNGQILLTVTGGVQPYSYNWSNSLPDSNFVRNLESGTYDLTVTDADGCEVTASYEITEPSELTAETSTTDARCGATDGSATVTANGGITPYTYVWNDAANQTTATATNLAPGDYTVTITDDNGCLISANALVNASGDLTVTTTTIDPDCGDMNGSSTANVSGGTGNYTYAWNDAANQTTATANNLTAGTYIVIVTDSSGCTGTDTVTLNASTNGAININTTVTNATCNQQDGAIDLTVSGGMQPYTITWDNGIGNVEDPDSLGGGIYNVMVEDANGCSNSAAVIVGEDGGLSISISSTNVNCNGGSEGTAVATASGGSGNYTYVWSDGLGTNREINNVPAGTYTVTATDTAGCRGINTITILEPDALIATATNNSMNCGDTIGSAIVNVLGGTPGYTYQWNDPNNQTTQTAVNLSPGDYIVVVTDANSCTTSDTITMAANMGLVVTLITTDVLCNGGSTGTITTNVSNGTAPYSYQWNNSLPDFPGFTGLQQGTYMVTVTDANGCFGTAEAKVHGPDSLKVTPEVTNADCNTDDGRARLDVTGGTPEYSYAWGSPVNANTQIVNGLAPGTYPYTVTDVNGCIVIDSVIVLRDTNCVDTCNVVGGTITTTDSLTICAGDGMPDPISVSLTGNQGATSAWVITDEALNILELPDTSVFDFENAGVGVCLIWNVSFDGQISGLMVGQNAGDVTGCTEFSNFLRVVREDCTPDTCALLPSVITTTDLTVFCVDDGIPDSVRINLTIGNGDESTFVITDTALNILEVTNSNVFDFEGTTAGICLIWNVTYESGLTGLTAGNNIEDVNGCYELSETITVIRRECRPDDCVDFEGSVRINNPAGPDICAKASVGLSTSPSDTSYSYSWTATGGNFDDANSATPIYTMMMPGTYNIIVTVTRDSCVTRDTTSVTILEGPSLTLNATDAACQGDNSGSITSTVVGGTPLYSYNWSDATIGNEPNADSLTAGIYTVTVTDANGCTAIDTATVGNGSDLQINLIPTNPECGGTSGGSIIVIVSGGTKPYLVNGVNTSADTAFFDGLTPGQYETSVTDANGCTVTDSATIVDGENFDLNINNPGAICAGDTLSLSVNPNDSTATYQWTASAGNILDGNTATPRYVMMMPGTYQIILNASKGNCTTTDTSTIIVLEGPTANAVPTDVTCAGDSTGAINLTATSPNGVLTYAWDNGIGNIEDPTGLVPGTYNVIVTDPVGCTNSASATVGVTSDLSISLTGRNLACGGDNNGTIKVTTTGGVDPISYAWSNAAGNVDSLSNLSAGTYDVTATDAVGCMATGSITITEPNPIAVTITNSAENMTICPGTSVNLSASPIDSNLTYAWTASAGNFDDASSQTPVYTMMMAGTHEIILTVSNGGCTASDTSTVTIGSTLDYTISSTDITCNGDNNGSAQITINVGTEPISYNWNGGLLSVANPTGLSAGIYRVTITDGNNCQVADSLTIDEPDAISIGLNTTNIQCASESNGSIDALILGGTAPLTIVWSNGATNANTIDSLGKGNYGITVTDANGCTASDSTTVTAPTLLTATAVGADIGCDSSGQAYVTASGGTAPYAYAWNDAANQTTDTAFNLVLGDYTLVVTDANGCTTQDTVSITESGDIVCSIYVINDIETFNGTEGQIGVQVMGGTGNYTYNWNNGGIDSIINDLSTNTYLVTVTDDGGCTCSDSLTLLNPAILGDFVFEDIDSNGIQDSLDLGIPGASLQLTGTTYYGAMLVLNTQTDGNGFYQFSVPPGDYKVTATDIYGYEVTTQNAGGDDDLDSDFDPITLMSQVVTLASNDVNLSIDLGVVIPGGCSNVITGGSVEANQALCGPSGDPDIITNVSFPTGGTGIIEYLWLKSDITSEYYPGHPDWMEIPNSNSPDYDPGVITQTTYYIRCARRRGCNSYPGESNIITKSIISCRTNPTAENLRITVLDGQVELLWDGVNPYENGNYIIEKSQDGHAFEVVATVESSLSETMEVFKFMDVQPYFGENYYRIKAFAPAAAADYSNVAMAMVKPEQRVLVYPNPAQKEVTIQIFENLSETVQVQVINGFGHVVQQLQVEGNAARQNFDLSGLPSGVYYLKFDHPNFSKLGQKIYKIKE